MMDYLKMYPFTNVKRLYMRNCPHNDAETREKRDNVVNSICDYLNVSNARHEHVNGQTPKRTASGLTAQVTTSIMIHLPFKQVTYIRS